MTTRFMIFSVVALILLNLWWCNRNERQYQKIQAIHDPRYHGADALTIGWKGEMIAYKWVDNKYEVMWRRQ